MFEEESAPRPMTNEEMLTRQLYLHQQIQQQMQMQMEMSKQLGRKAPLATTLSKVEPDLGDNVFDMLDDLIMIPSGAVAERTSLSKGSVHDLEDDPATSSRDSLADIMESLDMDLEDFEMDSSDSRKGISGMRQESFDESASTGTMDVDSDFDDDLDDSNGVVDHGVDDDDELDPANASYDEPAIGGMSRPRVSSAGMLASMTSSSGSTSQSGNLCTLIWEDGLLGLRLRMSQSKMMPAVSKITGRSSIYGIHLVDVGDLLMEIGDRPTREMEFIEAINYLKEVPKPCKLVFKRMNGDPMAVKPIQPAVTSEIAMKLVKKFDELANAEVDKAPPVPSVRLDAKYEVQWLDGPLGISLIASKDIPYPLVTRITGKNRSPQVQDVQPGHYLLQIGSYSTADGNFNTAIKFLQKVSKPVSLVFCPGSKCNSVRPEVGPDDYDHVWEKKQALCFTVRPDQDGRIVVADLGSAKSIKVKAKGGPNLNTFVSSGDHILWINDECTKDMTFHEALLKLRTAKRPLVIRFRKGPLEPPAELPPPPPAPVPVPEPAAPAPAPKPASRSFNPLKKIAAYAKENASSSANQRHADRAKHAAHSEAPAKKSIFSGMDVEIKRNGHHEPVQQVSSPVDNAASNSEPDHRRQEQQGSKLISLDTLAGLRQVKTPIAKSSSDPMVLDSEKTPANQVKPLTRSARNSTGSKSSEEQPSTPSPPNSSGSDLNSDEYEVIWPEGTALGLTLRVHPTTRFPVVARVTGTSNLKNIEHVTPGDILFAANNMPILPQAKFKQTLENLSKLPKPAILRFRRSQSVNLPPSATKSEDSDMSLPRGPPLKEGEYELVWRENVNLGLVFSSDADVPRVTKVDVESGGPNVSKVSMGDSLAWIGAMNIAGVPFHTSMATLRATKRPVILRFRR